MSRSTDQLPFGIAGERRRAKRVGVGLTCQAVTEDDFFLLGQEIVDASATGLLLRAEDIPALVGEQVLVSFRPPYSRVWIDAEARITRLVTGRSPGAPGFGLAFSGLSPFDRARLSGSLERWAPVHSKPRLAAWRPRPRSHDVALRSVVAVGPLARARTASSPFVRRTLVVR